jgi:hypothetical protein
VPNVTAAEPAARLSPVEYYRTLSQAPALEAIQAVIAGH